jgi:hypothetical protein
MTMFASFTAALDKYLVVGLAGVVVLVGLYAGVQTYRLSSAQVDLKSAQTTITALQADVAGKELTIKLQATATKRLEDRNKELVLEAQDAATEMEGIENAPAAEDGDVADVLCRAVSGTKCVRDDASAGD